MIPTILKYVPAGTSAQSFLHYRQNALKKGKVYVKVYIYLFIIILILLYITIGTFEAYDYGNDEKNKEVYNSTKPPVYNLKNVNAPTALFYGLGDTVSGEKVWQNY